MQKQNFKQAGPICWMKYEERYEGRVNVSYSWNRAQVFIEVFASRGRLENEDAWAHLAWFFKGYMFVKNFNLFTWKFLFLSWSLLQLAFLSLYLYLSTVSLYCVHTHADSNLCSRGPEPCLSCLSSQVSEWMPDTG